MMKAFSFFAFMLAGTSIWLSVWTGGGGLSSTTLNGAITNTTTAIVVVDNSKFAASGIIWIGHERIKYTSKTGLVQFNVPAGGRGWDDTEAASHNNGVTVRADDNGLLNDIFGFDVGGLFDTWGFFAFPVVGIRFFTTTVPHLAQGNIGDMFQGDGLGILVNVWLVFGAGFIFMIVMALIGARRGAG